MVDFCCCTFVCLVPYFEEAVPTTCTHCHPILCDAQARHSVVMSSQHSCSLCAQRVPNITVKVVVASQQQAARLAEGDTSDATDNVIVAVHAQFLVGPDVEHSAGSVITSGCKSVAIRKEHYRVYITFMSSEGLNAVRTTNIPQLG